MAQIGLNNEQKINVKISNDKKINTSLKDLNYIPEYRKYEEERRKNESQRITNENDREEYIEQFKYDVESGKYDGKPGPKGDPGTTDHSLVTNRDLPNQHPMSAITGLEEALANAGTKDHSLLTNRDLDDQHPISAITGLEEALNLSGNSVVIENISVSDYGGQASFSESSILVLQKQPSYINVLINEELQLFGYPILFYKQEYKAQVSEGAATINKLVYKSLPIRATDESSLHSEYAIMTLEFDLTTQNPYKKAIYKSKANDERLVEIYSSDKVSIKLNKFVDSLSDTYNLITPVYFISTSNSDYLSIGVYELASYSYDNNIATFVFIQKDELGLNYKESKFSIDLVNKTLTRTNTLLNSRNVFVEKSQGLSNANKNLVTDAEGNVTTSDYALGQIIVDYFEELPTDVPVTAKASVKNSSNVPEPITSEEIEKSLESGETLVGIKIKEVIVEPDSEPQYISLFNESGYGYTIGYSTTFSEQPSFYMEIQSEETIDYVYSFIDQTFSGDGVSELKTGWNKIEYNPETGEPIVTQISYSEVPILNNITIDSFNGNQSFANNILKYEVKFAGEYTYTEIEPSTTPKTYYWRYTPSNVQSDWNEVDSTSLAYIKNKPDVTRANLNTFISSSLQPASEILKGSIELHRISKTGNYDDILNPVGKKDTNGEIFNAYDGDGKNSASGNYSSAQGMGTKASSLCQHVEGAFNVEDAQNKYLYILGNGTNNNIRSNAHTVDWQGNAWFEGNIRVGGTSWDTGTPIGGGGSTPKKKTLTEASQNYSVSNNVVTVTDNDVTTTNQVVLYPTDKVTETWLENNLDSCIITQSSGSFSFEIKASLPSTFSMYYIITEVQ